jgi:tetratricopeptide (TPR) repeat protein
MNIKNISILFIIVLLIITSTKLLILFNDKKADYTPPTFVSKSKEHNNIILAADKAYFSKNHEKALELYRKVLAHYPDNYPLLNRIGTIRLNLQNYAQAEMIFTKLIKNVPDQDAYILSLAISQLYQKKYEDADKNTDKALKMKTQDLRAFFIKAAIAASKGDSKAALHELSKINNTNFIEAYLKKPFFDTIRKTEDFIAFQNKISPPKEDKKENE